MRALIFVAEGVQDQEFFYPYYRLQEAKFDIDIYSSTPNPKGKYGIPIPFVDNQLIRNANEYNLLYVPGGWQCPEILRQDRVVLDYLRTAKFNKQWIATICHGPQVLISANIVNNVKMTCYKGMSVDLYNAGAHYQKDGVVADGEARIISAQHYDDNPEFMRCVLWNVTTTKTS